MTRSETTLHMQDISIEFPGVKALDSVDFAMRSGTIRALIGANGAGKSTLMKVLAGAYTHYTGEVRIDGKTVVMDSTRTAKGHGIDIVYQEVDTALIPYLSVAENIMLDYMVNDMKGMRVSWSDIHQRAKAALERLGLTLDLKQKASELQLAEKQMVLIARAIVHERKFLILDEPTAPLSQRETDELFRVVRDLASNHGVGIIFISHRLPELFSICEDISIMKDGKMVREARIDAITQQEVIEAMLGRSFEAEHQKHDIPLGDPVFSVDGLTEREGRVKDVSFGVRAGEVVGIAGLVGAGKTELLKTLFGVYDVSAGTVAVHGKPVKQRSPYDAVKNGIGLVPEERRKEGILVDEPIYKNMTAANIDAFTGPLGFLRPARERAAARKMIEQIGVKTPNETQQVALLSGGNQQKVAVGKWLLTDVDVLLFDEPTKGVDVGAKGDIFDLITRLAEDGKGIVYASSELNEILRITDRVYVMYDGEIVKELVTRETSEEEIMYYATGGRNG
ncbi:sugar ABC transporter ATP-binding protein [Exiguobacterium flavidum]|uniref:sugar ABC transporter ATP-binding protein n=1 Tax=Exiguobacterium flavidum TaxID=2184695 RepID=UPI000DF7A27D|nr:sugar ABC transporter ATP-binding protein [Exiguobacterium flavidum]